MRTFLLGAAFVLFAPVIQAAVVNGMSLPGGPFDLVLIGVIALASRLRPPYGAVLGFAAGLAADIAPPADHVIGTHALVLCLAGWFLGRTTGGDSGRSRIAMAVPAALGAVLLDALLMAALADRPAVLAGLPGALAWNVFGAVAVSAALDLLPHRSGRWGERRRRWGHPA